MTKVAFLGMGEMGRRMARRLLDADYELGVWNRTPEKAQGLIDAGATALATPAAAAQWAEVVITMLADPRALRAVTQGSVGIASTISDGTTMIEMSTVGSKAIGELAASLPYGTAILDAPVLGSLSEVEEGSLRVFVGGDKALFERMRPLFDVFGTPMHIGPLGSGAKAKLVANSTLFGSLGVLGEALALADALGLDRARAFDVLSATPVGPQADRRREAIEKDEFPLRFSLALALKDASLVNEAAVQAGADLRLAAAARSWLWDAVAAGAGERDYSAVLAHILKEGPG